MTDLSPSRPPLPMGRPQVTRRRLPGLRTVSALMLREMSTTYGRSPGGYLWAILEPVAGTLLMTAVFAAFFKMPPLGTSFPLFFATGIVPFTIFTGLSGAVAQAVNFSRPLLAYPSVTWVDAILARFGLHFLTDLMVAYILFAGIMVLFPSPVILNLAYIAGALALTAALAMGVGILNCFLFTQFPVWQRGWSILMRPMFVISGALIPFETIPQPWRDWLWYNPVVHLIGLMRRGFYFSYDAPYVSVTYVLVISGVCAVVGLVFLSRYHRDLINNT